MEKTRVSEKARGGHVIVSESPAGAWQQGFLLGNGFMGQVLYGHPFHEVVELSELTFFSGSDTVCPYRENAAETFERMRRAAKEEDWESVTELTRQYMGVRGNYGTNLPAGSLHLDFEHHGRVTGYRRSLDLDRGLVRVGFAENGLGKGEIWRVDREAFCSHEDRVFAYLLEDKSKEGMTLRLSFDGGGLPCETFCGADSFGFREQALENMHSDGSEGVRLVGLVYPQAEDGRITITEEGIKIAGAHRAVLYVAMDTDYTLDREAAGYPEKRKKISEEELYRRVKHTLAEYPALRERHVKDVSGHMGRQRLRLGREEETCAGAGRAKAEATAAGTGAGRAEVEAAAGAGAGYAGVEAVTGAAAVAELTGAPAEALLAGVRQGDPGLRLTELMYQYGRYLLLSSSREDSVLPAPLQGVWNDNVACRIGWTCDMHLDINTQMNYWISEAGNLPGCHLPVFRWMERRLIPNGRDNAKYSYGRPGWAAELVSNAWGYAAPYWAKSLSPCPTGGIWQASDYMEHYRYGQDKAFLREHAYPVLREAVEFFLSYVFEEEGGLLGSGPSISPENAFVKDGKTYYASNGCTYEILMIRELFTEYLEAWEELAGEEKTGEGKNGYGPEGLPPDRMSGQEERRLRGTADFKSDIKPDSRMARQVRELLPKLPPYRILPDGTLAEWAHDCPSADAQHRHTSHLLGLFPYAQLTPETTPDLCRAAEKSIAAKLTPYENWEDTGWARTMLTLYSARLGKGEEAYRHLRSMQEVLTGPNLLVMHPPTRGAGSFMEVYELDGNTGFSMAVMEMLVQSHGGVVRLLPALPGAWRDGEIEGVPVRGGLELDMRWRGGRPLSVRVRAKTGGSFRFAFGDRERILPLQKGSETEFSF